MYPAHNQIIDIFQRVSHFCDASKHAIAEPFIVFILHDEDIDAPTSTRLKFHYPRVIVSATKQFRHLPNGS